MTSVESLALVCFDHVIALGPCHFNQRFVRLVCPSLPFILPPLNKARENLVLPGKDRIIKVKHDIFMLSITLENKLVIG